MSKAVLIMPPESIQPRTTRLTGLINASLPLGLGYIASNLRYHGHECVIIDGFAKGMSGQNIVDEILRIKPDLIGISVCTPTVPASAWISRRVKDELPETVIVWGNTHPSLVPEETLRNAPIDYVVIGEGEETLLELMNSFEDSQPVIADIKGLAYLQNGKFVRNYPREFLKDVDSIPDPDWREFRFELYRPLPHWALTSWDQPVFPVLTSRGCPFQCTFCSLETMGTRVRWRSLDRVFVELHGLVDKYKAEQIFIWDPIFPLKRSHGMEFCRRMIDEGLSDKLKWTSETRVNTIDPELLAKMREAGCKRLFFGIESGVQELLDSVNKGFTLKEVESAVKMTQEAGIEVVSNFILGFPKETPEMTRQTIEFAKRIDPDFCKFNILLPYPGSKLHSEVVALGLINTKSGYDQYSSQAGLEGGEVIYSPPNYSPQLLAQMQKKANREFYLRPKIIFRHLLKLRSLTQISNYFKAFKLFIRRS